MKSVRVPELLPRKGKSWNKAKTIPPCGGCFALLLLLVFRVLAGNWVELDRFVLLTWVLLYLVIVTGVVNVTFTNAVFVAG